MNANIEKLFVNRYITKNRRERISIVMGDTKGLSKKLLKNWLEV